jgi:hypothetical protein
VLAGTIIAIGLGEVFLRIALGNQPQEPKFYRPHEKYAQGTTYQKNIDVVDFYIPHGDLLAIDPLVSRTIVEPRLVRFKTDNLGYRNDFDYQGQSLILVGDSFIVGNGTSQEATMVNVLKTEHRINAYSISFPSDPQLYFEASRNFIKSINGSVSIIMFVFEGNDFRGYDKRSVIEPSEYDKIKLDLARKMLPFFQSPRLFFNLSRNLERKFWLGNLPQVEVYRIKNKDLGFFGSYIDASLAHNLEFDAPRDNYDDVMARIKVVFFIPTKYRVYFNMLCLLTRTGESCLIQLPDTLLLENISSHIKSLS